MMAAYTRVKTSYIKTIQHKNSWCDWRLLSLQEKVPTKNKNIQINTNISEAACSNIKSDKKLFMSLHAEVEGTNVKRLKTLQSKVTV